MIANFPTFSQNGIVKSYYPDGKIQSELSYVNDVLDGNAIWYYQNGKVMTEKNYSKGIIDGQVRSYFEDGQLQEEYLVSFGIKDGLYKSYFENGDLKVVATYSEGKILSSQKFDLVSEDKIALQTTPIENQKDTVKEVINPVPVIQKVAEETKKDSVQLNVKAKEEIPKLESEHLIIVCEADQCPRPEDELSAIYLRMQLPNVAKALELKGTVIIEGIVSREGILHDTRIIEGVGYGCDQQVESALTKTKFSPAVKKGEQVETKIIIRFPFKYDY
jgi:hypothetical protein